MAPVGRTTEEARPFLCDPLRKPSRIRGDGLLGLTLVCVDLRGSQERSGGGGDPLWSRGFPLFEAPHLKTEPYLKVGEVGHARSEKIAHSFFWVPLEAEGWPLSKPTEVKG